jgi:protein involved in polysaccharide export with SLBB domain
MKRLGISLIAAAVVWSCASNSQMRTAGTISSGSTEKTIPEYRLGFGDVVDIKFFRNEQFNETVTVRPDGRISLAKVGELYVAGMPPAQLDSIVTETYRKFVLEPEVTVIVREFGGYKVYVLGEVNLAGGFAVERNMTLLQAIAAAGGPKLSAKMSSVMVLRRGYNKEVEAIKVDLTKSVKAKRGAVVAQNDILVEPRDIIYVPKTLIANVSDFMRQVYAGVLPPLDLYLRAIIVYENL